MKIRPGAIPAKNMQPKPQELQQKQKQFNLNQVKKTQKSQPLGRSIQMRNMHEMQANRAPDLKLASTNLNALTQNPSRGPGALRMVLEPMQSRAGDLKLLLRELSKKPGNKEMIGRLSNLHEKMLQEMRDLPTRYHHPDPARREHLLATSSQEIGKIDKQINSLFKELKVDNNATYDAKLSNQQRNDVVGGLKSIDGSPEKISSEFQQALLKGDVKISEDGKELGFTLQNNEKIVSVFVQQLDIGGYSLMSTESIPLLPPDAEII